MNMKSVEFLGDSRKKIKEFPDEVKQDAGYQLDKVQRGDSADDFKPLPTIGKGVQEIRIWHDSGTYRVVCTAKFDDVVYVLHAFQKKTEQTSKHDLDICRDRYKELIRSLKNG